MDSRDSSAQAAGVAANDSTPPSSASKFQISNSPSSSSASPSPDLLLTALLHNHLNLDTTARETNTTIPELIRFLQKPETQEAIDTYQRTLVTATNIRILSCTADARLTAIKQLEELNKSTTNPIEQRRACSLILRYSTPITMPSKLPLAKGRGEPSEPPLPEGGSRGVGSRDSTTQTAQLASAHGTATPKPLLEGGVGVDSRDPRAHAPAVADKTREPRTPKPLLEVADSPRRGGVGVDSSDTGQPPTAVHAPTAAAAAPLSPTSQIPHPTSNISSPHLNHPPRPPSLLQDILSEVLSDEAADTDPAPSLPPFTTPDALLSHLERTLTRPKGAKEARAHTLLNYFTPSATIDHKPLEPGPQLTERLEPLLSHTLHVQRRTIQSNDRTHLERLSLIRHRQPCLIAHVTLERSHTAWRVGSIMTLINSS